jgi:hypothetical protein
MYLDNKLPELIITIGRIRQCKAHNEEKNIPNLSANDCFCIEDDNKIKLLKLKRHHFAAMPLIKKNTTD